MTDRLSPERIAWWRTHGGTWEVTQLAEFIEECLAHIDAVEQDFAHMKLAAKDIQEEWARERKGREAAEADLDRLQQAIRDVEQQVIARLSERHRSLEGGALGSQSVREWAAIYQLRWFQESLDALLTPAAVSPASQEQP